MTSTDTTPTIQPHHTPPRPSLPHYTSWRDVPDGVYATATQLKQLDLPRTPGPRAATVDGYDGLDRRTRLDLYRLDEAIPTSATAAQLASARARSTTPRTCEDCGARPDHALIPARAGHLCRACHHIHKLRTQQANAATRRAWAQDEVATLLAATSHPLAALHVDYTWRGTTPSGTRRPPSAATLTALNTSGTTLTACTVRLVGLRSRGIPDGALDPADGAQRLSDALSGHSVAVWDFADLQPLRDSFARQKALWPLPDHSHWTAVADRPSTYTVRDLVLDWRGAFTPTGNTEFPLHPGRADRLLYLLHEMAGPRDSEGRITA